mgnify:CR=1 FL=1
MDVTQNLNDLAARIHAEARKDMLAEADRDNSSKSLRERRVSSQLEEINPSGWTVAV